MGYLRIIGRPFDLSGGPLIFLEKKVCILDTFLRESCTYFYLEKNDSKIKKVTQRHQYRQHASAT